MKLDSDELDKLNERVTQMKTLISSLGDKKKGEKSVINNLHPCGRYMAKNGSLQHFWSEARKAITYQLDEDVDIENAHPTLLHQVLERFNVKFPLLASYVKERSRMQDDLECQFAQLDISQWLIEHFERREDDISVSIVEALQ